MDRREFVKIVPMGAAAIALKVTPARAKGPERLKKVKPGDVAKINAAIPKRLQARPRKRRKILVFWRCDGFYHGCIPVACKLIELMGQKTGAYQAVIPQTASEQMDLLNARNLAAFDGVLFNNTTRLNPNPQQQKALIDFVKGGKGFIGIHAASDNFYKWPEGAAMVGGLFAGHPWGGGGTWAFKVENPDNPVNKSFGGEGFKLKDEIYNLKDPYTRADRRILLSLDMDDPATGSKRGRKDRDQAVAWIKKCGKGRVFYCSLGHHNQIFWEPKIVAHYLAGIQYALGDLKADDSPVA
ncbi:MAG: ThuA domain-containing protein [Planctomycetota bacterium]|jgi:type 1 glutamine amidotransferase